MKNITRFGVLFLFLLISMFYTDKSIDILKNSDPIMKQIKNTKEKYNISPIDAVIKGDEIISGNYGKEIDYDSSYNKMKRYGKYNEALTVLKETKPDTSIDTNYDKYLVKGNSNKRSVALLFKLGNIENIDELVFLLEEKNIQSTFFIDGKLLEKELTSIKKLSNHEIEILSYDNSYDSTLMKTSISYLEAVTNRVCNYCYTENSNDKLLKQCAKLRLHTIKPTIVVKEDIYLTVKKKIESGIVISIDDYEIGDLSYAIDYIKSKGYNLVTVADLFNEK